MASNSKQRSGSSGKSAKRKKVVITGEEAVRSQSSAGHSRAAANGAGEKSGRARSPRSTSSQQGAGRGGKASAARGTSAHGRTPMRASSRRGTPAGRVADARRDERERRLRRQRAVMYGRIVLLLATIGALTWGAVALYRSDAFAIERVDVVGNDRVTAEEILELAEVPEDATLLRFPGAAIGARLESDPRIARAAVTRDFPDAMRIRVDERTPEAYVDLGTSTLLVVDPDAFVVATETPEATSTLVVVRDIPPFEPVPGEIAQSAELKNALSVLGGLSSELRERVRAISAPSIDKTTLITTDGIEILVGPVDDMARKDLIARRILDEQAGKVVYINVRSVDRPTWRGINK